METAELRKSTTEVIGAQLSQLQSGASIMGVVGLVLMVIGYVRHPDGVWHSYLFGYMFWLGATTGSLALLMLHHTVGGGWGFVIRRFLEAATRLLPIMAVLFIPVLIGLPHIYKWAMPGVSGGIIEAKSWWLNTPFFIGRWVFYFAVWGFWAFRLNKLGAIYDERSDQRVFGALNRWGASGLVVYCLTITFAGVDAIMSLDPQWSSSIFGMIMIATQGLTALAMMIVLLACLGGKTDFVAQIPNRFFRDLGNLMLVFVMLWGYMCFSQYVITYAGNMIDETTWFLQRRHGGWGILSIGLIAFHFAIPFFILLVSSPTKRDPRKLAVWAGYLLLMRAIDIFWWVKPTFRPEIGAGFADLGAPLLIGGIWLWCWAWQVRGRQVVPFFDPRLQANLDQVVSHG